ncbi:MAG: tryptophan synthase subunit alpha [Gammaproteobacteria bacterium]
MIERFNIEESIQAAKKPALVAFITAGHPTLDQFIKNLKAISKIADVIEIGIPFTDPLADGLSIQNSSLKALQSGASLVWTLDAIKENRDEIECPLILMSYLNPLLAFGFEKLASASKDAGIQGFIVPDLPIEESFSFKEAINAQNINLINLVSPATPEDRLGRLCKESQGFVYAVTKKGVTGGNDDLPDDVIKYLQKVKKSSSVPVCAGFGIRGKDQVEQLAPHIDGVILGSVIIDTIEQGGNVIKFLENIRHD